MTEGAVDHLRAFLITEFRSGGEEVSTPFPEVPDATFGGITFGFHGTGPGGSRSSWHHHISGTFAVQPGDPPVNDPNVRRVVACYAAYSDAEETEWSFACVVVVGEGAGNTGAGDRTGGPGGSLGAPIPFLLIALIAIAIVVPVGAVVAVRRRRRSANKVPPDQKQPPAT